MSETNRAEGSAASKKAIAFKKLEEAVTPEDRKEALIEVGLAEEKMRRVRSTRSCTRWRGKDAPNKREALRIKIHELEYMVRDAAHIFESILSGEVDAGIIHGEIEEWLEREAERAG